VLIISDVLTPEDCARVREKLNGLTFRDGARTAGAAARQVKHNQQADLTDAAGVALAAFLADAVQRHPVLSAAAWPHAFSPLLISRTRAGGNYGPHVDNALMHGLRTDLSFTLFLSDPATYDGGALAIDTPGGIQRLREAAGSLVLYASGAIHEVEPVTQGERLVAVGWIESAVRDASAREALFDIARLRADLVASASPAHALLRLDKITGDLLRRWAGK
jgi:PKHD-type hydroxylase